MKLPDKPLIFSILIVLLVFCEGNVAGGIIHFLDNGHSSQAASLLEGPEAVNADQGTAIERNLLFLPVTTKPDYLNPSPQAGYICLARPKHLDVTSPENRVQVVISGTQLCGLNSSTTLTVNTDLDAVDLIEWYYTGNNGNAVHLTQFDNSTTIRITDEGIYEVVVISMNVVLGSATYEVGRVLEIRLSMRASQHICREKNLYNRLDPGDFASYIWSKEGEVVSTDSIYIPREPGQYALEVVDHNGCNVPTQFEVEDICENLFSMPNAMVPEDQEDMVPEKGFIIYANPAISDIEVFVFNKLGELIYYCQSDNNGEMKALCMWNGYVNGTKLMVGTYPVTIKYRVPSMNLSDQVNKFIVVPQ